jgi:hypothetical protein
LETIAQKNTIILLSVEKALNQLAGIPHVGIAADLMVSSLYEFIFLYEFFHFGLEELFKEKVRSKDVEAFLFLL